MASAEDWLLGDVISKAGRNGKPEKKIHRTGELDIDAVVALMDVKKDGERLRVGLDGALAALDALKKTGLTGEALVLLVTAKTPTDKHGNAASPAVVQRVLEGLMRIGEFVR